MILGRMIRDFELELVLLQVCAFAENDRQEQVL